MVEFYSDKTTPCSGIGVDSRYLFVLILSVGIIINLGKVNTIPCMCDAILSLRQ